MGLCFLCKYKCDFKVGYLCKSIRGGIFMQDVERNEILFMPLLAEAVLMVNAPLFDIESGNTIESRIQAVSTEN